jgi:hypothetical protein
MFLSGKLFNVRGQNSVMGAEGEPCARFRVFKDAGTRRAWSHAGLNYRSRVEVRNGDWAFTLQYTFRACGTEFRACKHEFDGCNLQSATRDVRFNACDVEFHTRDVKFHTRNEGFRADNPPFESRKVEFQVCDVKFDERGAQYARDNVVSASYSGMFRLGGELCG